MKHITSIYNTLSQWLGNHYVQTQMACVVDASGAHFHVYRQDVPALLSMGYRIAR